MYEVTTGKKHMKPSIQKCTSIVESNTQVQKIQKQVVDYGEKLTLSPQILSFQLQERRTWIGLRSNHRTSILPFATLKCSLFFNSLGCTHGKTPK